ncbi:MAG: hypothetical protein ACE366_04285 [Bradymonadia bacterium]
MRFSMPALATALVTCATLAGAAHAQSAQEIRQHLDVSALEAVQPPKAIPKEIKPLDLSPQAISLALGEGEMFDLVEMTPTWMETRSPSFTYGFNPHRQLMIFMEREDADRAGHALQKPKLSMFQGDAMDHLSLLGVTEAEVLSAEPRRLMSASRSMDEPTKEAQIEVHAYKTFVDRGIGGVPVLEHRLVVTHGTDGRLRKVMGRWGRLAEEGHRLSTTMSTEEIARFVARRIATGEPNFQGKIPLEFVYVPVSDGKGAVQLQLKVQATYDDPNDGKFRADLFELPR